MWAVFLFVMGIIGIVLINTFGVITTTNQQDYTLLKNATEAAMMDAIDLASYRVGFYLCLSDKDTSTVGSNGVRTFNSAKDYYLVLKTQNVEVDFPEISNTSKCSEIPPGETKLNKEVFVESFIRRFANNVNNNKSYEITVQEVIEYPPKVSVRLDTYNTYNSQQSKSTTFETGDYSIRNQIDAILESQS